MTPSPVSNERARCPTSPDLLSRDQYWRCLGRLEEEQQLKSSAEPSASTINTTVTVGLFIVLLILYGISNNYKPAGRDWICGMVR